MIGVPKDITEWSDERFLKNLKVNLEMHCSPTIVIDKIILEHLIERFERTIDEHKENDIKATGTD